MVVSNSCMVSTWMVYSPVVDISYDHMFDVMLPWTWMAFSHIGGDVSNQQSRNQENKFRCWPHNIIVGLAKAHPNYVEVAIYMDLG